MAKKNGTARAIFPLPERPKGGTTVTLSFSLPTEIADEIRAAADALSGRPHYLNQSRLTAEALADYLPKLRKRLNSGKAFILSPDGRRVRRGRPLKHQGE